MWIVTACKLQSGARQSNIGSQILFTDTKTCFIVFHNDHIVYDIFVIRSCNTAVIIDRKDNILCLLEAIRCGKLP